MTPEQVANSIIGMSVTVTWLFALETWMGGDNRLSWRIGNALLCFRALQLTLDLAEKLT